MGYLCVRAHTSSYLGVVVIYSLVQLINYRIGSGGVLMFITKHVVGKMLCLPQIRINKHPLIKQSNGATT
jgi:hypothetical protein